MSDNIPNNEVRQLLSDRLRVWLGGLDKKSHREEIHYRVNEIVNKMFGNRLGTNCIQRLHVPPANKYHKKYRDGHKNQGSCTVFFKHQKYADYFKSLPKFIFYPMSYYDRDEKRWMESTAIKTEVDIREPDPELTVAAEPLNNIGLRQLHGQPTARQPTSTAVVSETQSQPVSSPTVRASVTTSVQPNDDSDRQPGANDEASPMTREPERPQEPHHENSDSSEPTLSQMQADLFRPDFFY